VSEEAAPEGGQVPDHERVLALADRFWGGLLETQPILGTSIGDERFDDRLPDPSPDGRAREETLMRGALEELSTVNRDELDVTTRTTTDVLETICRRSLAALEHRTDLLAVASHLFGPANMLGEIASLQRADTPERLDRYEARLRAFDPYLTAWAGVAGEGIAAGVTSPRVVVERSIAQIERILELGPAESPALLPVGDDGAAKELIEAAVRESVNPAYAAFLDMLRGIYLPRATETIGLSALPRGDAMYGVEVLSWTSLPLDARDVHDLGVERFESIQEEKQKIATRLRFANAAEATAARIASDEGAAASPEALVKLVEDQVQRSWEAAPRYFGMLPSANCEVRRVEEFREADMPFAFYNPPTDDGSRPGIYYVNTYDFEHRPLMHMAAVTYHEANPGHHFQIAIEQEMPDRPALRRFGGGFAGASFAEGWGLYSERLADEMGLYLDDWERLGMLDGQAHRAARLITDTGIHALGWDRERAIDKLVEGGNPRSDAEIEVDRYIAMPAQALSYMIGMIEIERARESATAREGSAFSLKNFHDRVLSLGQVPLPAFRRELGTGESGPDRRA
jgi:uncharacterized protein (DUF885 family)